MSRHLDYEGTKKMVRDIAVRTASKYPAYIEAGDVEGELWVYIYSRKDWIESSSQAQSVIAGFLKLTALEYCEKEKARTEGYDVSDLYKYSLNKLRTLLPDAFEYIDWQSFGQKGEAGMPHGGTRLSPTTDRVDELIDVRAAIKKLPVGHREVLYYQYHDSLPFSTIAETLGVNEEAAKKRAQRALRALQKRLGRTDAGENPSPLDRRTVRSNAAARADLANKYDGN